MFGDEILSKESSSVSSIEAQVLPHLDEMWKLMKKHEGVGLAAPQAGIPLRFFIYSDNGTRSVAINPEILSMGPLVFVEEGCLSGRSKMHTLKRPSWVVAKWVTINGIEEEKKLSGEMAKLFMHEVDHLRGITITDRLKKKK